MNSADRLARAKRILEDMGLLEHLGKIGTPHVIGSARMDLMAWNDLDIDVENETMNLDCLYELTAYILKTFRPVWYEAKEEIDDAGKTVWFHGFEADIDGERWNFDIWFFDRETIEKAERYCDAVTEKVRSVPGSREAILKMKEDLIAHGRYGFDQYASMDVYRAVLEQGITSEQELLERYARQENRID